MDIADDWHISSDGTPKRIDEFWNRVFQTKDDNGKVKLNFCPKLSNLCFAYLMAMLTRKGDSVLING